MQITTPSGYQVFFKEDNELTYGERRQIKRAAIRNVKIEADQAKNGQAPVITGEVGYDMQDETLRALLKKIIKPDGKVLTTDLLQEIFSWKNEADGDAVFSVIENLQQKRPNAQEQAESPETKNS